MRLIILIACLPTFAGAWEFTPQPVCTLSQTSDTAEVVITHDPNIREYRMNIRLLEGGWAASERFGITYRGERPLTIGTDRHRIDGKDLSVADTGFGNVLNGLEFNDIAIAFTTKQTLQISLNGAAPRVQEFRKCAQTAPATS